MEFDNYKEAKDKFDKIKDKYDEQECDMQLYQILHNEDNVSAKM